MNQESEIIQRATFTPRIKTYILLVVAFYMLISVAGIPLLLVWFLGVGQAISRHYYQNLICSLTTRHLEYRKGVLFMVEKTIPLENIQDLTFLENPLLKLLDLRILKIETASASKPGGGSDMKLVGIVDMQDFKQKDK
jgi:putative membrane protein